MATFLSQTEKYRSAFVKHAQYVMELVMSNRPRTTGSSEFETTLPITPHAHQSVQLLLRILLLLNITLHTSFFKFSRTLYWDRQTAMKISCIYFPRHPNKWVLVIKLLKEINRVYHALEWVRRLQVSCNQLWLGKQNGSQSFQLIFESRSYSLRVLAKPTYTIVSIGTTN